jgi:hypothetical protein
VPYRRKSSSTSIRKFLNCIFTVVTCHKWPPQKALRSSLEHGPRQWQRSHSSSRTTHILYISPSMNIDTSSQKQLPLETSMSYLVIHSKAIVAERLSNNHVSQLATSTVCNNTLYIILYKPHRPPHYSCNSTNNHQEKASKTTAFKKRVCSSNQENTCSYQSCSMNLSRYRGWPLHCISKPYMQTNLCTFSLSPSNKEKANKVSIVCRYSKSSHLSCICRPLIPPTKKQTNKQKSITYTIYLHSFLSSFCSTLTVKPKANLQITTNPNYFPTNLKKYLVSCPYQNQHRTCK